MTPSQTDSDTAEWYFRGEGAVYQIDDLRRLKRNPGGETGSVLDFSHRFRDTSLSGFFFQSIEAGGSMYSRSTERRENSLKLIKVVSGTKGMKKVLQRYGYDQ